LAELTRCAKKVDMIWTTSDIQRQSLEKQNQNTYHLPHAVDISWWENNYKNTPREYQQIGSPRAVYTGPIQTKMDMNLIIKVAQGKPQWNFVFIGPIVKGQVNNRTLRRAISLPNLHFLGERKPDQLPGYIHGADILMLPYICDENRRYAGLALKYYEYLVSGHPIIATPYTDMETKEKDLFYVGSNHREWLEIFDHLKSTESPEKKTRRIEVAAMNIYGARIETQRKILSNWFETKNKVAQ
jgi:glycosyltransferase involved in cell wall biosynthesis